MSFDVFLQGFRSGEAVSGEGAAVMDLLRPMIESSVGDLARIAVTGGQADVYGIEDPSSGLMFNHIAGDSIWPLLFEISKVGGFCIMPVDCQVGVPPGVSLEDLPAELRDSAVLIKTGTDLEELVEGPCD